MKGGVGDQCSASGVTSQSESNLASLQSRRRDPFADSSDEDDFVDVSDLPPIVPAKVARPPPTLPAKQRINKSKADLDKINETLRKSVSNLAKGQSVDNVNDNVPDEDYDEVPDSKSPPPKKSSEFCPEDYDEPVPLPSIASPPTSAASDLL